MRCARPFRKLYNSPIFANDQENIPAFIFYVFENN